MPNAPKESMTYARLMPELTFTTERLRQLQELIPEAFADGALNLQVLREVLGEYADEDDAAAEHFGLNWPGKRAARRLAVLPSRSTLAPQPGAGVNESSTKNLFLEGDNLEVLKLLQKAYGGRVKMIYIDPPYNTGNDVIYKDSFADPLANYLRKTGQADEAGVLKTNTRADGRFHSNWLSMMYPRLRVARSLLREDGVIFVSIDDGEFANLRIVMNEVFGEECFLGALVWRKKYTLSFTADDLITIHEYIVAYKRSPPALGLTDPRWTDKESVTVNPIFKSQNARSRKIVRAGAKLKGGGSSTIPAGDHQLPSQTVRFLRPAIFVDGQLTRDVEIEAGFAVGQATLDAQARTLVFAKSGAAYIDAQNESKSIAPLSILLDYTIDDKEQLYEAYLKRKNVSTRQATDELQNLMGDKVFDNPKPSSLLRYLMSIIPDKNALVLDFFAGSCTTAHAVLAANLSDGGKRQFIVVQIPELCRDGSPAKECGYKTIAEIGKERLRRSIKALKPGHKHTGGDLGFRVLRLSTSHFRNWQRYRGTDVKQLQILLDEAENTLVEGWTPESLLIEVMLIEGFALDSSITAVSSIKANSVQLVTSNHCAHKLLVCFDPQVKEATLASLELRTEDVFVCLDSALTDQGKQRLADRCTLRTI
jgi:adenine-specific DNA-methyltransferase